MSWTTGDLPLPTPDSFDVTHPAELICPGASNILLTVTNNAVVAQLAEPGGRADSSPVWGSSFYLLPGAYPLSTDSDETIDGIRVRSATPGKPANIAIAAFR